MSSIVIEGGKPLLGSVRISGARNSVLKLMAASMLSNEDVVLQNVPKIEAVEDDISIIKSIGGKAEWAGVGRLILNGSEITSNEIPYEIGSKYRTSLLMAPPLLYRFGKASIPKHRSNKNSTSPNNRILEIWDNMGITVEDDGQYYRISSAEAKAGVVNFRIPSHMATDIVIMTAAFLPGVTEINNASEEAEIDDLVDLIGLMGGEAVRTEPKVVKITGSNIFKGAVKDVQFDKSEAAIFAMAALMTKGNIIINGINRNVMIPLVNFFTKIGGRYEFEENSLKVWRHEEELTATSLTIAPTPGFVPDWQSTASLLLTQCNGISYVHDTVYTNRFDYIKDLNRMGAKIELMKPSEAGMNATVSDDSYNLEAEGEPYSVAKIVGPAKLKGEKLDIADFRCGPVQILAALIAEGRSEISGVENIEAYIENFINKLSGLGVKIWTQWE